jgi:hypothetical protein
VSIPAIRSSLQYSPPQGSKEIKFGDTEYHVKDGEYYRPSFNNGMVTYVETRPPEGLVVDNLPDTSQSLKLGDKTYYSFKSIRYEEITENGKTKYKVVRRPAESSDEPLVPTPKRAIFESED